MCEDDARVMLKKAGTDASTTAQLKKATNKILEEHHAILFLYKSDKAKYGQLIEQIENYILQGKDPFPKSVMTPAGSWQDGTVGMQIKTSD